MVTSRDKGNVEESGTKRMVQATRDYGEMARCSDGK
jgi:hypothetical protein